MGRFFGRHGQPKGWGNPCRSHGSDAGAHEEAVRELRERLCSPAGKWHRLGFCRLVGRRCACHCAAHLPCHIDALQDTYPRLVPHRAAFWRPLKLDGLSLAEAGLRIRSHVSWLTWAWRLPPHGKWKHDTTEREAQRSLLPFPLFSSSPRDPMIPDMALAALRGEKDVYALVTRAGEDAWLNLSQWALNWMHDGRHGSQSRPGGI